MLKNEILLGLGAAIVTGAIIGIQTTYLSRSGAAIGAARSGLLTTVTGAAVAGGILLVLWRQNAAGWQWGGTTWLALLIAGVLGTIALVGIAFASQHAGVTGALASVLLGQMLVAVVVDARGWGATEPIPFSAARLLGIVLLVGGVFLVNFRR